MKLKLFPLFIMCLPNVLKIMCLNMHPKHHVHPSAKIGFLTYLDAEHISIGKDSVMGAMNLVKGLEHFELGKNCAIGTMNRFTATASEKQFTHCMERKRVFQMNDHAGIVNAHFFDCNDAIEIGKFTILAGFGTSFFTHGIDFNESRQGTNPILIGDYCMVGPQCLVLKGAKLPNFSVLAGNSTLHKSFDEEYGLYSGVPAHFMKKLDPVAKFFHRTERYID
ncbi:MAG: acyltransferase [Vampirovibrionales bacterium]